VGTLGAVSAADTAHAVTDPAAGAASYPRAAAAQVPGLVAAYAAARDIPAGDVAGVRPGSVHVFYDAATGIGWALAGFLPSARASSAVLLGFQDEGSAGVFTQHGHARWRMIGYPSQPLSCTAAVPRQAFRSWGLARSGCGSTSRSRPASGRPRAASVVDPATIAKEAQDQVGVADTPASTDFSFDCNPFTTLVGGGASTSGCGTDPKFKVQDENEEWCSDFTKWAWEQGGVTSDLSVLTGQSATFYQWALDQGQHPAFDSGTPQVGDAVVFYPGSDSAPNATYADHVGVIVGVNSNGTLNLVNGDFAGTSNISVQANNDVSLSSWAASIWGSGEHWIFVSPGGGGSDMAFQANTGHLWYFTPSNAGNRDTGLGMANGTSPAIASSGEVAFQGGGNNHLWLYDPSTGGNRDTGLGMKPGTSPAIVSLAGGGYEIAFQANTGILWLNDPSTGKSVNTGLGMDAGTSPAITATASSYEVAFQANNNHLWYYTPSNAGQRDTGLGMEPGTSPAITATASGSPEIAFQANNNDLWYYTPSNAGQRDTGLGMDAATSPAITSTSGGGYEIAFQANNNDLWLYTTSNAGQRDTGLGMDGATSPDITASTSGSPEVTFQANDNDLWYYTSSNAGERDTGLGMDGATSPDITASTSGSPEVTFQANDNDLWYYTSSNAGERDTGLGMAPTSNPAILPAAS
jgi:uncharacterized protein YneR